jgi:putative transposase
MTRPAFEMADIVRRKGRQFLQLWLAKISICRRIRQINCGLSPCKNWLMVLLLRLLSILSVRFLCSRRDLLLENLALRQQLNVLRRRHPQPRFAASDRLFWVMLRRLWCGWKRTLILVQPETVVRWHRAGFRVNWTWLSRHRIRAGRKCVSKEFRELIFRMTAENSTWGAPRIHGELKMLGFDISERTVLRWMRKPPRRPEPAERWAAFLNNHREAIAAIDFFSVPTLTFGVLYCFFVIAHDRRRILHYNVTEHPNSAWVVQQLREAFPYDSAPSYLVFDRGTNFNEEVIDTLKSFGIEPKRPSFRSPWQNGVAERWVGTCRRDLLDHVIVLSERHLKRLMSEYIRYYHEDRTHLALAKGTPDGRESVSRSDVGSRIIAMPRLGGLHHRYDLAT